MRNIKLIIEYDGTAYCGWQLQPNGITIQQVIEESLEKMLGQSVRLQSSGRTDAGVHALGMVAVFKTQKDLPVRAFSDGLNCLLPPDIAIRDASEVPLSFNPRADAISKHYRYTIYNSKRRSPLTRLNSWHLRGILNMELMQLGASHFVGEHDFAAFRASNCVAKTTIRRMFHVSVAKVGDSVIIDVHGSGFLKNMVRVIAGTLVAVGQGKLDPSAIPGLLAGGDRSASGITAPPQGLCLMEVFY
ncbi:tRNA pseudouridine38/39/40 synthase [Geotalea daltonii FRC-32]|uniref:tRNA pseudouridine synthase A n=1 Tax=Geotalea daltonii (strain DSM 22248 / JCM 15807 / FRC-32) TaxID=316067 RepID=TRUA_GEODF|nr:tRNA pseudouridine(38-40) synthase TruA [Geotalea daltonii]B9M6W5.1 RecName: Full=tRNA pseudouridine synthase A; AltName: Full=tRNA pseudouridine(38-40) synthase; AltName: Full=tRNA pseudouridylate synthase I; AltName: Full=tRNA-uridine isomerase I [Geotalea daltonii FRC-32]ACM21986.1 tRNA pseudouridine38/39/40 synthase [Geotalea daltonii FRC-32]